MTSAPTISATASDAGRPWARATSVVMPWTAVPPAGIARPRSTNELSSLAPHRPGMRPRSARSSQ